MLTIDKLTDEQIRDFMATLPRHYVAERKACEVALEPTEIVGAWKWTARRWICQRINHLAVRS